MNFKQLNWKAIALFGVILFYACLVVIWARDPSSPIRHGGDYLAFWSAGRLADQKGFSQIYDLKQLNAIQTEELQHLHLLGDKDLLITLPAPYFSIFMLPFKYLSSKPLQLSYWIWVILNLGILIGYLLFFLKNIFPEKRTSRSGLLFLLLLASFPVFDNLVNGQLNIFMLVCLGEFIRNASKKKVFIAGLWLGGLLLKPQLLILIIPVLLVQRQWKSLLGFASSAGGVFLVSLVLSGVNGMIAYARLLTGWGEANTVTAPGAMINWRMISYYLSTGFGSTVGWIIAGLGIALIIAGVVVLLRRKPVFGSSEWVVLMLAVFAATLMVTWHAHAHMALVLIPLLLYAGTANGMFEKPVIAWVLITPASWFGLLVVGLLLQQLANIDILNLQEILVAFSGFISNLVILIAVYGGTFQRNPAFTEQGKLG